MIYQEEVGQRSIKKKPANESHHGQTVVRNADASDVIRASLTEEYLLRGIVKNAILTKNYSWYVSRISRFVPREADSWYKPRNSRFLSRIGTQHMPSIALHMRLYV